MKRIAFVGTKLNDERNIIKCLTIKKIMNKAIIFLLFSLLNFASIKSQASETPVG